MTNNSNCQLLFSIQKVKDKVVALVDAEAEQWLGCAMTYSLFQAVQEHIAELTVDQPETIVDLSAQIAKIAIAEDLQMVIWYFLKPKSIQKHYI